MNKLCWTRFYDFDEVLKIKPFADPDSTTETDWSCLYKDQAAYLSTENGCTLDPDGELAHGVCGIYWIRFINPDEHPSKFYEYIGLAARRTGAPNQTGIFSRLKEHVRKIQHLPDRGKIGIYMYKKEHDDGKSEDKIRKNLNKNDSQLKKKYRNEFSEKNFNDYQEIRDFFRDNKNDKDLIEDSSTVKYTDYFNSHKEKLKDYESTKSFLEKNMKIRFFVIPKQEREKLYIELAEALSFDAYKKTHDGKLPQLCDDDESKKLACNACNGDTSSVKNRDKQFDLEIDTKTVEEEIGILNGFWDFDQQN